MKPRSGRANGPGNPDGGALRRPRLSPCLRWTYFVRQMSTVRTVVSFSEA
jgi:hypothetical protein